MKQVVFCRGIRGRLARAWFTAGTAGASSVHRKSANLKAVTEGAYQLWL